MDKLKVYCINNDSGAPLTIGKWYDVIRIMDSMYVIINDVNKTDLFFSWRFLSQEDLKKQLIKERYGQ